jgi:hypothetical protein
MFPNFSIAAITEFDAECFNALNNWIIRENCSLQSLDLTVEFPEKEEFAPFCDALTTNRSLKHIGFPNCFKTEGNVKDFEAMVETLSRCSWLTSISFRQVSLLDSRMETLCNFLYAHPNINFGLRHPNPGISPNC